MLDRNVNTLLYTCHLKLSTASGSFRTLEYSEPYLSRQIQTLRHIQVYSCTFRHTYALPRHIQTRSSIFRNLCNSCTFKTLDYLEPCLTKSCHIQNQGYQKQVNNFFSIWVFFHERSRFTRQQGKGEVLCLILLYHYISLHTSAHSRQIRTWESLVSERKSLTTKLRAPRLNHFLKVLTRYNYFSATFQLKFDRVLNVPLSPKLLSDFYSYLKLCTA